MRPAIPVLALAATLSSAACAGAPPPSVDQNGAPVRDSSFDVAPFGRVHVLQGASPRQPLAIFVSGDGGWDGTADRFARELVRRGYLVAGVDIETLRDGVKRLNPACADFAALFSRLARETRGRFGLARARPTLVGHSAGATAVYIALAESGRARFAGALSLSFPREFEFPVAPCARSLLRFTAAHDHGTYDITPATRRLSAPWNLVLGTDDDVVSPSDSREFAKIVPGAVLEEIAGTGHSLDQSDATEHALDHAVTRLRGGAPRTVPPSPSPTR